MAHHDLVIIGSGSGNSLVTADFADRDVAIIESGTFGGTCLNVGCIPTKMFVYAADVATAVRGSARFGIDATLDGVRWRDIRDRVFGRIDPIAQAGEDYRANGEHTTAYLGRARFTGPRELAVTLADGRVEQVSGDQVVIAAGAHAFVPDVVRDSGVDFHTSDTIMRIEQLPRRLAILGGGFIAAEFAHVFSALGSEVTIATRGAGLLTHLEPTIGQAFNTVAREQWELLTHAQAARVERTADGVRLTLADGRTVEADALLVATGRRPNVEGLGLDAAGVELTDDGRVAVDEHGRTSAEGVWALGDVSSPYELKHVANHEARVVAHNLAHPDDLRSMVHTAVPAAVFTHPQIATLGLSLEEAVAAGHDAVMATKPYSDTAYGWAMEDRTGIVTLVADRSTGRLLGAHLMGPHASSLIQPLVQAMSFDQPVVGLARGQYWIHPALAEVVENAILALGLEDPGR
ncbi:MAG: mycothione reductase [Micrococcales bacterium]|nr:mycothione reductase [Micrococcales bacterium]